MDNNCKSKTRRIDDMFPRVSEETDARVLSLNESLVHARRGDAFLS